jgi:hypothetical protein
MAQDLKAEVNQNKPKMCQTLIKRLEMDFFSIVAKLLLYFLCAYITIFFYEGNAFANVE